MFDICTTKYKCSCGGEIDHYTDEDNINNFYLQCRKCGSKYFNISEFNK